MSDPLPGEASVTGKPTKITNIGDVVIREQGVLATRMLNTRSGIRNSFAAAKEFLEIYENACRAALAGVFNARIKAPSLPLRPEHHLWARRWATLRQVRQRSPA